MNDKAIERLSKTVVQHGEAHVTVEEHDAELELRRGQTSFDHDARVIEVTGPDHTLIIGFDRVVDWYAPRDIWHE